MFRLLQSGAGVARVLSLVAFAGCPGCTQPHSLRRDAEVAEHLAIRYADAHSGPHSGNFESMAEYGRVKDQQMAEMFKTVAARYGVSENQVRESLTRRPVGVDLLVMLSFAAFYAWVADIIVRRTSIVMTAYASVVLSGVAVLVVETGAMFVESVRLGTGHLSYRLERVPWSHHRLVLFIAALALCWLVAMFRLRRPIMSA